ncbi:hypothetical protein [Heyndrickxia acidicola]|uniref:50S ribosomal protein L33 n=1 Tax=Heyndrickxia acidicola TaxID=209389 RepID=A0ABU6MD47_9BACI|nr:hypothetical protein [Heyndrickxia acidicola]MED1202579.1 hypothetical protein [Heyndrickxia acidicola]
MNREEKTSQHGRGKSSYKIGEAVEGERAVFTSKTGKEEWGRVVYKRKPDYRYDPYKKLVGKERDI